MIEPRPEIARVVRVGAPTQERDQFICLDKNERVDPFPETVWREMLDGIRPEDLARYPVLEPLYAELADYLQIPRNRLLLTNGSDGAIRQVHEVYARAGDVGIMLKPTYAMYEVYAQLFGLQVRALTFDQDLRLPVEEILDALKDGVGLVLLANPNAPTGTLLSAADMGRIIERAAGIGAMVLVDEAYYYFSDQTVLKLVERFDNLIVARTFSKAGGLAGARLGFVVSQPRNIEFLNRVKPLYEINGIAMRLGRYLLRHPELLWDYAKAATEGRAYLSQFLADLGLRVFDSHANFVVARPPAGTDIKQLVQGLHERGYLIKGPFGDPPLRDCIRVTTASVPIMARFTSVFSEVYGGLVGARSSGTDRNLTVGR